MKFCQEMAENKITNYFMNKWLNNFAYRVEMSGWIFPVGGFLSLGIALFTVSQTLSENAEKMRMGNKGEYKIRPYKAFPA